VAERHSCPLGDTLAGMSRENIERLRRGYEAFNDGGVDAIVERLAPEFQAHDRESSPDRETYHGGGGIRELFEATAEAFDELRLEPEEFIDAGDQTVVVLNQHVRGRRSRLELLGRVAHVWTMREGRAIDLRIYRDREQALKAIQGEGQVSSQG
jgi:ketosteroid isomerase-like protein